MINVKLVSHHLVVLYDDKTSPNTNCLIEYGVYNTFTWSFALLVDSCKFLLQNYLRIALSDVCSCHLSGFVYISIAINSGQHIL